MAQLAMISNSIGEILNAKRRHLILPRDAAPGIMFALLQIDAASSFLLPFPARPFAYVIGSSRRPLFSSAAGGKKQVEAHMLV